MKTLVTMAAVLAMSAGAAFAEEVGSNNGNKGNTGLGDVGAYNYQGNDNTNHNQSNNTTNSNNVSEYNTTSTTTVNNAAQKPNGYVTSMPQTTAPGTCGTSASGGISAPGLGLSAGKIFIDEDCNRRANSTLEHNQRMQTVKMLNDLGLQATAVSLLCQVESTRIAMKKSIPAEQYNKLCKAYEI